MNNFDNNNQQQFPNQMMSIPYPITMGYIIPPQMYSQFMYNQPIFNEEVQGNLNIFLIKFILYQQQMILKNLSTLQNMNNNNMGKNNYNLGNIHHKYEGYNSYNGNEEK